MIWCLLLIFFFIETYAFPIQPLLLIQLCLKENFPLGIFSFFFAAAAAAVEYVFWKHFYPLQQQQQQQQQEGEFVLKQ
jgi:hypothetical protein